MALFYKKKASSKSLSAKTITKYNTTKPFAITQSKERQQCNYTISGLTNLFFSEKLAVIQESAKPAAVQMIQDCNQELLIEFKGCRKLKPGKTNSLFTWKTQKDMHG